MARAASGRADDAGRLARGVLAVLEVEKPCGYETELVVKRGRSYSNAPITLDIEQSASTTPDEAHWIGLQIVDAAIEAKR